VVLAHGFSWGLCFGLYANKVPVKAEAIQFNHEWTLMNLKNAVQPRMDTDGHGLRTGYVDERLHPIGEPFIVFPSVFIRVHPWFLQVKVPDLDERQ